MHEQEAQNGVSNRFVLAAVVLEEDDTHSSRYRSEQSDSQHTPGIGDVIK